MPAFSQSFDAFFFKKIPIIQERPYDPVKSLTTDQFGFLWIGHQENGIYRYDGHEFEHFKHDPKNPNSLPSNRIVKLLNDQNHDIWVATFDGGIARFNMAHRHFDRLTFAPGTPPDVHISKITNMAMDKSGRVWVSTFGEGLFYFDPHLPAPQLHFWGALGHANINAIFLIDKTLYAVGEDAWIVNLSQPDRFEKIDNNLLKRARYSTVYPFDAEHLLIGSDLGLFLFDLTKKTFVQYYSFAVAMGRNDADRVRAILKYKGHFLIGTESGLMIMDFADKARPDIRLAREGRYLAGGLTENRILCLYADRFDNLWVGNYHGLEVFNPYLRKFEHYFHQPGDPNSMSERYTLAVYGEPNGKIWASTRDGKINIIDRTNKSYNALTIPKRADGKQELIYGITPFDENQLLLGGMFNIYILNKADLSIKPYQPLQSVIKKNGRFRKIALWKDSLLLASSDVGLIVHDPKNGNSKIVKVPRKRNEQITYPPSGIKNVYIDQEDRVWLSLYEGIAEFFPQTDQFRIRYSPQPGRTTLLDMNMLMGLYRQGDTLWAGSFNAGLFGMHVDDPSEEPFIRVNAENGLPNNVIYDILPGAKDSELWLSSDIGLIKFETGLRDFSIFSEQEGMQGLEFNMLASHMTESGELIFGGVNGVNAFHPKKLEPSRIDAEVYLSKILKINTFNIEKDSLVYQKIYPYNQQKIELGYEDDSFIAVFSMSNVTQLESYSFYYRLLPLKDMWIKAGAQSNAIFTNLRPGDYTLEIRAVDKWQNSLPIKKIAIYIRPPFWQKPWFFVLVVALVVAVYWMGTYVKARESRKQKIALEKLVNKRTIEVTRQKELAEQQMTQLERSEARLIQLNNQKKLVFSVLSHDLRSPLTTLKAYLDILDSLMQTESPEAMKGHFEYINQLVGAQLDLIENVLFWTQMDTDQIQPNRTTFNVVEVLQKAQELNSAVAKRKQIHLQFEPQPIELYADPSMAYLIVRNLISNALKFTPPGGSVVVSTFLLDGYAAIRVKDQGIGMSEEAIARLLSDEPMESTRGTQNEKGTGIGFMLSKHFARINHGEIRIKSKLKEGSEFTLLLPLASMAEAQQV